MGPAVPAPIAEVTPSVSRRAREAFFRRALFIGDLLAGVAAFQAALFIGELSVVRAEALVGPAVLVLLTKTAGLYDRDEVLIDKATSVDEVPTLFHIATLVAFAVAIAGEAAAPDDMSAVALVVLWLCLLTFMALFRAAARAFAVRHTVTERCLVIGDADAADLLSARLKMSPSVNSCVVGYVPLSRIRADDPPPLGSLDQLAEIVGSHEVVRVIVAGRGSDSELLLDLIRQFKALGLMVSVLPRIFEVVGSSVEFDEVEGVTVLGLRRFGLTRWASASKRMFDVVGSAAGLAVVAPLLAAIAVLVKLDSSGPVFFRQWRIGQDGEAFKITKFRTMVADAEARKAELRSHNGSEGLFKLADDPRITPVGAFLRRTSLDELPQLFNVLLGHMSLVGPRPLVRDEDERVEGWYRRRLHLKPGMTGPWQILGSGRIPLYEMVKIDYLYVTNWSMWSDVKLLIRTLPYVLARRGL